MSEKISFHGTKEEFIEFVLNEYREPVMEADRLRLKSEYEKNKDYIREEQIRGYFSLL